MSYHTTPTVLVGTMYHFTRLLNTFVEHYRQQVLYPNCHKVFFFTISGHTLPLPNAMSTHNKIMDTAAHIKYHMRYIWASL